MTKAELLAILNSPTIPHDAVVTIDLSAPDEENILFDCVNDGREFRTTPLGTAFTSIGQSKQANGDVIELP